jgi:hypothetical protein
MDSSSSFISQPDSSTSTSTERDLELSQLITALRSRSGTTSDTVRSDFFHFRRRHWAFAQRRWCEGALNTHPDQSITDVSTHCCRPNGG